MLLQAQFKVVGLADAVFTTTNLHDVQVAQLLLNWAVVVDRYIFSFGALVIGAALIGVDFAVYQSAWGPPLGWGVFTFTTLFYGSLGVSFMISAVLAVPG